MLTEGTRVRVRWSGKVGTVLPRDLGVVDRLSSELVKLDPFVPQWAGEVTPALTRIEVIYQRDDLLILSEES